MHSNLFTQFAAACGHGNFLTFNHTWYSYLDSKSVGGICTPVIHSINDLWLIVAAVIEILIRIAALAAIGFVIYAGFEYQTSQGSPEKTARARSILINSIVGLVIAISSAGIINLIASSVR
jgi:hypothetical protein